MSGWFSIKCDNQFVFPNPEPPIIIFYMDDLEYMANFYYVWFIFINTVIKVDHFLYLFFVILYFIVIFTSKISLSHTLKAFVPYGYVVILSNVCSLLSSLLLKAILFTSSV